MGQGVMQGAGWSQLLGRGLPWFSVGSSATFALLCLFYLYTIGTFFRVTVYPLIDRVTYYTYFELYVVTEFIDHIVIGSLLILWLTFSLRKSKAVYALIGIFAMLFVLICISGDQSNILLGVVAISSLPVIFLLLVYDRVKHKMNGLSSGIISNWHYRLTINYGFLLGIIIGAITLAIATTSITSGSFSQDREIEEPTINIRQYGYAYEIFLLLSTLSPIMMLLLIAAVPVKLVINGFNQSSRNKAPSVVNSSRTIETKQNTISNSSLGPKSKLVYLAFCVFLSVIVALIPHSNTINPDGQLIGVDTPQYAIWMAELGQSSNFADFLHATFVEMGDGDRPLSLIIIYCFLQVISIGGQGNDTATLIEYLPLLLGPSLVLVIYFLTRELTSDDRTPLFASFLTAISFQTLVGIYAGFYANWIALILGYLSFVFLMRFLKKNNWKCLIFFGAGTIAILLSHVYAWSIFVIAMGVFIAVCIATPKILYYDRVRSIERDLDGIKTTSSKKGRKIAIIVFLVLLGTVGVDIGRTNLTGSSGGVEKDLELGESKTGIDQFISRWNNLTYAVTTYVGGIFSNFIVLSLGLYWLLRSKEDWSRNVVVIAVFLSVGILPFLFGQWTVQTRVFYNIPFQIPAAFGFSLLVSRSARLSTTQDRNSKRPSLLLWLNNHMWLLAMSIIAVSNFYLVSQEIPPVSP